MTDPVSSAFLVSPPLLSRVASGDPEAVRECLARYGGLVWSIARRMSKNQADAEDATQEIFVDLWKSASRFDPSVASEATFIATIARRRLIDRRRRESRRTDTEPLPDANALIADAAKLTAFAEISADVSLAAKALSELRPEERNAVILSAYYGLSHEEIASSTGMALGTVKTHARRGLIHVREILSAAAAKVTVVMRPKGGSR
jgi:RNA polymerase sigma-70 factor (ECF subfamily)